MIGQMAIASALPRFKDLGLSVTPILFSFQKTDVICHYLHIVQKCTKNQCGKLKKNFKISVHRTSNSAI